MYKQLYQFYTQNHRYRFVSVKIPAACGERPSNRCPVLPPSAFVKTWPCSCLCKLGDKGNSWRTNSGIATQKHYQTDAFMILGPYSPQPHNLACFHTMAAYIPALHWQHSGLLPWGHLVYIQTDWASILLSVLRLFLQLPSGQGFLGKSIPPGGTVWSECLAYYFNLSRRYKGVRQLWKKKIIIFKID